MSALRADGWEAIGAHCGTEVVRWLALADLAGKPRPTLLVLSPSLRAAGGARINGAIAASVGDAPILYLSDGDNHATECALGSSRSRVARWPLDLDDFRTIVELLVQSPARPRT